MFILNRVAMHMRTNSVFRRPVLDFVKLFGIASPLEEPGSTTSEELCSGSVYGPLSAPLSRTTCRPSHLTRVPAAVPVAGADHVVVDGDVDRQVGAVTDFVRHHGDLGELEHGRLASLLRQRAPASDGDGSVQKTGWPTGAPTRLLWETDWPHYAAHQEIVEDAFPVLQSAGKGTASGRPRNDDVFC